MPGWHQLRLIEAHSSIHEMRGLLVGEALPLIDIPISIGYPLRGMVMVVVLFGWRDGLRSGLLDQVNDRRG